MPVVTPFGDLSLEDEKALEAFLLAHRQRHGTYVKILKLRGRSTFQGPVDGDWMFRHAAHHASLATITGSQLGSAGTKVLALPGKWRTEQELVDWHDLHSRHHLTIDRRLKL